MRKFVVTENITLDGVIDMAKGWFEPLNEDVDQSDITAANSEHREAADALLVGRNTFESFREFWPKQTDDPTGVSDYLSAVAKYVVSAPWTTRGGPTTPCCADPSPTRCKALNEAPGRDIVATGSPQLVHALVAGGAVDEYRLFVFPVVVGGALFESADIALKLLETRPFVSGAVLLRYAAIT